MKAVGGPFILFLFAALFGCVSKPVGEGVQYKVFSENGF